MLADYVDPDEEAAELHEELWGHCVAACAGQATAGHVPCSTRSKDRIESFNLRLNFSISSGIFTKISQNCPNFLQSSVSLDILEHVREIPTKFHLSFGEK